VPSPSSLVQQCRGGMASHRVVSVWIFARVEQKSNDLDMTKIRCQSKCQMAVLRVGARKQPTGLFDAPRAAALFHPGVDCKHGHDSETGCTGMRLA
jgi:hypothetical protein